MKRFSMTAGLGLLMVFGMMAAMGLQGCAGIGVWSATAQQDITNFTVWANQWIGGALKAAPAIIDEASLLLGPNNQKVKDMQAAETAAQGVLAAWNAAAQTGQNTATAQQQVVTACSAINTAVSAVQAAVAQAKGTATASTPASGVSPLPAATTGGAK